MANFKMTWKSQSWECCSCMEPPLQLTDCCQKELTSGESLCPSLPPPLLWLLPFCPSCSPFWLLSSKQLNLAYNNSFLAPPRGGLLHLHAIWLPGAFRSSASSHDNLLRQFARSPLLLGSWLWRGIWGDVSSSYQNYLFQRSSCLSLAPPYLPT